MLDCLAILDRFNGVPHDGRKGDPVAVNLAKVSDAACLRLHDKPVIAFNIVKLRLEAEGVDGRGIEPFFAQEVVDGLEAVLSPSCHFLYKTSS